MILTLFGVTAAAQQGADMNDRLYMNAIQYANGTLKPYNPDKAFSLMTSLADEGYLKAMNALGIMHARRMADGSGYRDAVIWFRRAADAGYLRSYYNLSLMWKYGMGVEQNYEESYRMLRKGADGGESLCEYGLGYMHYKGLGCKQDYGVAMNWFLKSAEKGNSAAEYMIGLCLRNGYGVKRDTAGAGEWLRESGRSGNARADIELRTKEPESRYTTAGLVSGKRYSIPVPQKGVKVDNNAIVELLRGRFEGHAVTFDWSGEHVVSIEPLDLDLDHKDGYISGTWTEADTLAADIRAKLADTTLTFIDSYLAKPDHYHPEPLPSEFRSAEISMSTDGTYFYLTGKLHQFSEITMEPLPPVYFSLRSAGGNQDDSLFQAYEAQGVKLLAFLNPFTQKLNLIIGLTTEADLHVDILSVSGALLIEADCGKLLPGNNIIPLPAPVIPGVYVIRVRYGDGEASFTFVRS